MVKGFHARREFARLARFGANILDAHSCFIFLPRGLVDVLDRHAAIESGSKLGAAESSEELALVGAHSLSQKCIPDCIIHAENGLVGWVARHGHPIHVSPFEHDSRTLGTYSEDQQLKSFIAVPLAIPLLSDGTSLIGGASMRTAVATGGNARGILSGVLAADSKKAFAFSKLQGKLLEELSEQASSLIVVAVSAIRAQQETISLESFFEKADRYVAALGVDSVEALRISPANLGALERSLGIAKVDSMMKQLYRLFEQSLPPQTPVYIGPSGDLLCLVDNMMSSYFEGKAQALAEHVSGGGSQSVIFKFHRSGFDAAGSSKRKPDNRSVAELIAATIERSSDDEQGRVKDLGSSSVVPFGRFLRKVV